MELDLAEKILVELSSKDDMDLSQFSRCFEARVHIDWPLSAFAKHLDPEDSNADSDVSTEDDSRDSFGMLDDSCGRHGDIGDDVDDGETDQKSDKDHSISSSRATGTIATVTIELCAFSGFLAFIDLQSHDPSTNLATLRMIAGRKLGALPRFIEMWDGIVVLNERRMLDLQVRPGITHIVSVRVLPYICTGLLSFMFRAWSDECRMPALADYSSSESNFQENSDSSTIFLEI